MYTVLATINMRIRKTDLPVALDDEAEAWLTEQIVTAHRAMAEKMTWLGFSVETSGCRFTYETPPGDTNG